VDELHLHANDLRFRCLSAGSRERPLALLLHGFPEGAEAWREQLSGLAAAGFWAVAPDLRGYGGSDCPSGEEAYRVTELVADVRGLADALGRDRCHLAGHDWGSLVGWAFASRHGDRLLSWSALSVGHPDSFLAAIGEEEDQRQRSSYIETFLVPGRAEEALAAEGQQRLRAVYRTPPNPDAIPEEVVDIYLKSFARPGRLTGGLNYYRANLRPEALAAAPLAPNPITTRTQLIWGDQDPWAGRRSAEGTARLVAGEYRLEVLEGAGHWLQFDRPAEVTRLLAGWMARPG
jgi:pimeloyl-ACP methyl ester carboxylesterase